MLSKTVFRLSCLSAAAAMMSIPAHAAPACAAAIHTRALVLDAHADVPLDLGIGRHDAAVDSDSPVDLPKLERGEVDAVVLTVFVNQAASTPEGYARAREEANVKLAAIRAIAERYPARATLALSAADIEAAAKAGKRALIVGLLNAYPLGKNLAGIDEFYKAGVRQFGFVHQGNNDYADSSRPIGEPKVQWGGLSPLGKEAIPRLNRLGVIIDVSQLTPDGLLQTVALSKAPVIASHSGIKGVVPGPRNLSDQELDAIKQSGGLVGVVAFKPYLKGAPPDMFEKVAALRAKYGLSPTFSLTANDPKLSDAQRMEYTYKDSETLGPARITYLHEIKDLMPVANVSDLVNSIDYAVRRIGIDHVGISSDFNHSGGIEGFSNEAEARNVTVELLKHGYSEAEIDKLWGGNYLRVFRVVEAVSKQLSAN